MDLFVNKHKLSKTDLKEILPKFKTLDRAERSALLDRLSVELDQGGVSKEEWLEVIKDARHAYEISEVDYKYLKDIT